MKVGDFLKSFVSAFALIALLVLLPGLIPVETSTASAQNKPAAEFQSLLNMRFYEEPGGFLVENIELVFPPPGQKGMLTINKSSGEEVASMPLRMEPFGNFPAFASLVPDGDPGNIRIGQPGDFVMTIKVGGEVITRFPFSFKLEQGKDPFNPQKRFIREGPWRDWGFISVPMDDSTPNINFNFWLSVRELPAGMTNPRVNVHLMLGAQEIGVTRSPIVPSYIDTTAGTSSRYHMRDMFWVKKSAR